MHTINLQEAKTTLSRLVKSIESGETEAVIITRYGKPVAKLVAIDASTAHTRIGVAKGKFVVPESIDTHNVEVTKEQLNGIAAHANPDDYRDRNDRY